MPEISNAKQQDKERAQEWQLLNQIWTALNSHIGID